MNTQKAVRQLIKERELCFQPWQFVDPSSEWTPRPLRRQPDLDEDGAEGSHKMRGAE
jgi:hypothetical protein